LTIDSNLDRIILSAIYIQNIRNPLRGENRKDVERKSG
jgi:hypothetical protein